VHIKVRKPYIRYRSFPRFSYDPSVFKGYCYWDKDGHICFYIAFAVAHELAVFFDIMSGKGKEGAYGAVGVIGHIKQAVGSGLEKIQFRTYIDMACYPIFLCGKICHFVLYFLML